MDGKCTIYFADPFWFGVFERADETGYTVARFVFGSEPSDAEIHQFALKQYTSLAFSAPVEAREDIPKEMSYKRRLREARREMQHTGVGTYAQRTLQSELERRKKERLQITSQEREEQKQQKYLLRQERKKQKQRGR